MELSHDSDDPSTLVFQVHDGEVLSDIHKSQIVFALVCDEQPNGHKVCWAHACPDAFPALLQLAQPDSSSTCSGYHSQQIQKCKAHQAAAVSCLCFSISLLLCFPTLSPLVS